jgi:hypothetical protein
MAIQITGVEAALDQDRVVRPDHAIGCEVGALELNRHGVLVVGLVVAVCRFVFLYGRSAC